MPGDSATDIFQAQRPRLLRVAYRMLGSHHEAEDVVQEAWLRWNRTDRGQIANPAGWLTRVVTRLCIDQMRSARHRREEYPGTWLPEPLIEPADDSLRQDNLTLTLMLALERLSPLERAAFLLHDVFGQPLGDVAQTIGRSADATRQLASRARTHVRAEQPRYQLAPDDAQKFVHAFFAACKTGDPVSLGAMLAQDAALLSDGGGKVTAYLNVIHGKDKLLRLYDGLARKIGDQNELLGVVSIDGLPGFVSRVSGVVQTTALEIQDGMVKTIYITRNPDKLAHLPLH